MNPHFSLTQSQSMQLSMTPKLQQSIHILQLSSVELVSYLQEQSVENPLLDMTWHCGLNKKKRSSLHNFSKSGPDDWLSNVASPAETLEKMLLSQLECSGISEKLLRIARYLAGNLNDDGYLTIDLNEVCPALDVEIEEVQAALHCLQSLDPAGVGARNLKECLLLQINRDRDAAPWAQQIASDYLMELGSGKFKRIADMLNISIAEVRMALEYIRSLNPRPGLPFANLAQRYIEPDAFIQKQQDGYLIIMNEAVTPKLSINRYYQDLYFENDQDVRSYLRPHFQSAKWLIRSLEERQRTLYRVIEAIVQEQSAFFELGVSGLRPMKLKTVAQMLNLHESTISRTVQHKYVQTPQGLYELNYFFTTGLTTDNEEAASAKSVKARIKRLIEQEDKRKPLSDQKITDILTGEGIQISRRTVMKYREELHLLSSRLRGFG